MVPAQPNDNIKSPVKIGLPTLIAYADRIHVNSLLLKNAEGVFPAVVVEYVEFTDIFGQKYRSNSFCVPPLPALVLNCKLYLAVNLTTIRNAHMFLRKKL